LKALVPLYVKDYATADPVAQLAKFWGLTKHDAVRLAVQTELDPAKKAIPLRERAAALQAIHPLPPATGKTTDKGFFDDLFGGPAARDRRVTAVTGCRRSTKLLFG
jgi:hypothetical protein